jgi:multidrug efflux pump subunit AcrB
MFVFLQSWRATLIPTIAVPVVLLGTFAIFYLAGFGRNTADRTSAMAISATLISFIDSIVASRGVMSGLIPTIAVPVVLLGTFAIFYLAGFSINTLTLFGLVLARASFAGRRT